MIEDLEHWLEKNPTKNVSQYVTEHKLPSCFNKKFSKGSGGWREETTRKKIEQFVTDGLKALCRPKRSKPKWPDVETTLIAEMKAKRKKGKKVSERWMRVRSKQLMKEKHPNVAWLGSQGYQRR